MSSLPSISILIPIYNVEQYVKRCILSVMAQTYTGMMECILVDDCGTDKSIAVAEQIITDYHGNIRFSVLKHTYNRGLAAARNTAVEAATGDFIVHVDSDDWIEPNMIACLVAKQDETGADIVSCNAMAHYLSKDVLLEEPDYSSKDEMMRNILRFTLDHVIWRRLIRTRLYKDNNISAYEGVNIGEDHYTLPRLLFYSDSFVRCNEVLYHYNCENEQSYMQSHQQMEFSYPRYVSDIKSIDILIHFFNNQDSAYLNESYRIKARFIFDRLISIMQQGNVDAYKNVYADWETMPFQFKIRPFLAGIYHHPQVLYSDLCRRINANLKTSQK